MKKIRKLAMLSAMLAACLWVSGAPSSSSAQEYGDDEPPPVVAVMDIVQDGAGLNQASLKRMSEYLLSRMTAGGAYLVVPRDQLAQALVKQKVKAQEPCYGSCQISLAGAVAASKVLQAKFMKVGNRCSLILDLYDVQTETMEKSVEADNLVCKEAGLKDGIVTAAARLGRVTPPMDSANQGVPKATPSEPVIDTDIKWVRIPGGQFQMGSSDGEDDERPVHPVTLWTFEMAKTETTVAQYRKCVEAGVCTKPHWDDGTCYIWTGSEWKQGTLSQSFRGDQQPAVCIDRQQASAYANWVGGRLPTEAEWEYAARSGGRNQKYPWGNQTATCSYAVMSGGGAGCGRDSTWPVCSKTAGNTTQGLCDMAGNVWEMVSDWYGWYRRDSVTNPTGPSPSPLRVDRGGSWYSDAGGVRAAYRHNNNDGARYGNLGFRITRDVH